MKNPDYLTKDQLKEELIAHGIELPTGRVLKATYLELYHKHIVQGQSQTTAATLRNESKKASKKKDIVPEMPEVKTNKKNEESSEKVNTKCKQVYIKLTKEDRLRAVLKTKKGRSVSKNDLKAKDSVSTSDEIEIDKVQQDLDLDELTNTEIARRLRGLGHTVGPITATTRKVYLKKLTELLQSGDALESHDSNEDEEEEDEEEIEHRVTRSVSKRRSMMPSLETKPPVSTRKSSSVNRRSRSRVDAVDGEEETEEEREEETKEESTQTSKNQNAGSPSAAGVVQNAKQKATKQERRWIPIWLQIAFTILVVLFAYIVVQAMEKNPLPLSLPKSKQGQ